MFSYFVPPMAASGTQRDYSYHIRGYQWNGSKVGGARSKSAYLGPYGRVVESIIPTEIV